MMELPGTTGYRGTDFISAAPFFLMGYKQEKVGTMQGQLQSAPSPGHRSTPPAVQAMENRPRRGPAAMRVAIYAGMYKKDQDGATKTLYELTGSLLENGFEVGVWGFCITPRQEERLHLFELPSLPFPFYPEYKITMPTSKLGVQLNNFRPDVLHITVPDMVGIYLERYARRRGLPLVTSYHTDFPSYLKSYHLGWLYRSAWRYFRWFYNRSDAVLVPTGEIINRLQGHGIDNLKLWSRGIHLDRYNPGFRSAALRAGWGAAGKKVFLYSGRFVWYKDLKTFIGIYDLFKKRNHKDVVFVLAGDGPVRDQLERRMPDAHFTGYLHGQDLSRVYASSDILLFPSTTETFGNVVLEALASGTPAVVSDIGGCKEIIETSGAGLVARAREARHFYELCLSLANNPALHSSFRERGLAYARKQCWPAVNDTVIHEYDRVSRAKQNNPLMGTPLWANK